MTDERKEEIKKQTLWEYVEGKGTLETFRAKFRGMADEHAEFAKTLRDRPEILTEVDSDKVRADAEELARSAKEYKELLVKNEERRMSLLRMGVPLLAFEQSQKNG